MPAQAQREKAGEGMAREIPPSGSRGAQAGFPIPVPGDGDSDQSKGRMDQRTRSSLPPPSARNFGSARSLIRRVNLEERIMNGLIYLVGLVVVVVAVLSFFGLR